MARPEYVTCVLTGRSPLASPGSPRPENKTWSGRVPEVFECTFVNASHAVLNAQSKGRLLTCPDCAHQIAETLYGHMWDGAEDD